MFLYVHDIYFFSRLRITLASEHREAQITQNGHKKSENMLEEDNKDFRNEMSVKEEMKEYFDTVATETHSDCGVFNEPRNINPYYKRNVFKKDSKGDEDSEDEEDTLYIQKSSNNSQKSNNHSSTKHKESEHNSDEPSPQKTKNLLVFPHLCIPPNGLLCIHFLCCATLAILLVYRYDIL